MHCLRYSNYPGSPGQTVNNPLHSWPIIVCFLTSLHSFPATYTTHPTPAAQGLDQCVEMEGYGSQTMNSHLCVAQQTTAD